MDESTNNEKMPNDGEQIFLQGYPTPIVNEDIYDRSEKIAMVDLDSIAAVPLPAVTEVGTVPSLHEVGETAMGSELDVPGSELDDVQENIGSEDEENNYYSLSDNDDSATADE